METETGAYGARRQSFRGGQAGVVSFAQFFGSALQVTPHIHSLMPDGVFVPWEGDLGQGVLQGGCTAASLPLCSSRGGGRPVT